jgi:CheY-like chemotaxis protein
MLNESLILIAEDNQEDAALLLRAFQKGHLLNPLQFVRDGDEAISYLKGEGKYANREEYPLPALVLLDLNMPRKNGFEVLEWVRQQPTLRLLRIVVLTVSEEIKDVNRAYQLGANSFLVKPVDFGDFLRLVAAIQGYWLWLSREPEVSRSQQKSAGSGRQLF